VIDVSDPQTYWHNLTNIVVGALIVACCFALGRAITKEMLASRRERARRALHNGPFFGSTTSSSRNVLR